MFHDYYYGPDPNNNHIDNNITQEYNPKDPATDLFNQALDKLGPVNLYFNRQGGKLFSFFATLTRRFLLWHKSKTPRAPG